MVIDGGIVGAKVSCRGNLKVRFIHSSQISAGGDIIVEREVINSKIETDGALLALPAGKIFTSQVITIKGIAANQIGSSISKPCVLTIGVDSTTKSMIKKYRKKFLFKRKKEEAGNSPAEVDPIPAPTQRGPGRKHPDSGPSGSRTAVP